ncbi:hypothetical protein [Maritalea myrionectae]|uniref:hypothetical protein n=1 Tax=Maritalea myrionectae TaxID=454601 RepID=UPI00040ABE80|nr:hypothetical protein [Maritalea myrionectae]
MGTRLNTLGIKVNSEINTTLERRDEVLGRFGPMFRAPTSLSRDDYLSFLNFKHNYHWTNLVRRGGAAATDMESLRHGLIILLDEAVPLSERFDAANSQIKGVGKAILSAILLVAYPDRYGVWNSTSESKLKEWQAWPEFPRGSSQGERFKIVNDVLLEISRELDIDLWSLDALWRADGFKREKITDHQKSSWADEIDRMVNTAVQTTKYARGQKVARRVKNKDLRLDKERLTTHLNELLRENNYRCAISGLELKLDGSDAQLLPSLDRIDSYGHYEEGNLQVVAKFINFWKGASRDSDFRRLLKLVRSTGH